VSLLSNASIFTVHNNAKTAFKFIGKKKKLKKTLKHHKQCGRKTKTKKKQKLLFSNENLLVWTRP